MATVTAKVQLAQKNAYIGGVTLTFMADYVDGRNKEWAESTPSLTYEMQVKASVAELFQIGGKYTVTFEPTVEETTQPPSTPDDALPEPATDEPTA